MKSESLAMQPGEIGGGVSRGLALSRALDLTAGPNSNRAARDYSLISRVSLENKGAQPVALDPMGLCLGHQDRRQAWS